MAQEYRRNCHKAMYRPKMNTSDSPQSDSRSVGIVGPGAMGCLHAALLSRMPPLDVVLLDYRADRAELINEQGVIIEAPTDTYTVPVPCTADARELSTADLVIIFTKAYDTAAAAEHCAPVVGPTTAVLTLQNGLGNYQILQQHFPLEQVLAGTTSSGATLLDIGQVRQAGLGQIVLGSPTGNQALADSTVELLKSAGLQVELTADVDALLWRKVLINCAINPLTALTRRRNGELLESAALRDLAGQVAEEVYHVGQAVGIDWGEFDARREVEKVCRATAANQSSMLQDILAGRSTEVDYITGAVAQAAERHGAAAPLCQCLTVLIEGLTNAEYKE